MADDAFPEGEYEATPADAGELDALAAAPPAPEHGDDLRGE